MLWRVLLAMLGFAALTAQALRNQKIGSTAESKLGIHVPTLLQAQVQADRVLAQNSTAGKDQNDSISFVSQDSVYGSDGTSTFGTGQTTANQETLDTVTSNHYLAGVNALWIVLVLVSVLGYKYYFHKYKLLYVPESVASMLIGIIVGLVMWGAQHMGSLEGLMIFRPEMFFYLLLPPIIFKAGFGVERTLFFEELGPIIGFAFFGTIISTLIIGFSLFGLAKAGVVPLDTRNALEPLMFGTLISSTDPVSTMSIMSSLNTSPMLHALIFGESVLNDAVCITLYKTLEGFHPFLYESPKMVQFGLGDFGKVMVIFSGITMVSVMLGVACGLLCSMISKKFPMIRNHPEIEMGMTFFFAYACYCLGEIIEMSGIMALFFCAIVLAHYHSHNLSDNSKVAVWSTVQALGFFAETAVFVVLGITAVASFVTSTYRWSIPFVFSGLFLCILGRAVQVCLLSVLMNLGLKNPITAKMQLVMIMAGLRGAVSFALSVQVPASSSAFMATTTLAIVIVTTIVQVVSRTSQKTDGRMMMQTGMCAL